MIRFAVRRMRRFGDRGAGFLSMHALLVASAVLGVGILWGPAWSPDDGSGRGSLLSIALPATTPPEAETRRHPETRHYPSERFELEEATVSTIHSAFASGRVTCVQLVQMYLDRIEAYDRRGPGLKAILTVNPQALASARDMDLRYQADPTGVGPLHCIPIVVKDNTNTLDMPTTGGSAVLRDSRPREDAFVVGRLRAAGALMLAKANLTELARGGTTVSTLGGQTRNPYDLTRTPGGSSGGTGAAVAGNLAALGIGSDTGNSTRSPASAQSLVGVRPTRGLMSRHGVIPLSLTQDEVGPIARTSEDAARMLDVMVGYDPGDPITAFGMDKVPPEGYLNALGGLQEGALQGVRFGVLTELMGTDPEVHAEVNAVMNDVVAKLVTGLEAEVVEVSIPNLSQLTADLALASFESRVAMDAYLAELGPDAPVRTMVEFVASGGHHPEIANGLRSHVEVSDGLADPEYKSRLLRRNALRLAVMQLMAEEGLDAILYPHQRRLVAPIGEAQLERNGVLSNGTGFPAVTFPGGFSQPTDTAPLGVPVGVELLGPEWSEARLLGYAHAFEQAFRPRKPPASTPPLP